MQSTSDLQRECLLHRIEGAIEFRSAKAEQYPDDMRNVEAVDQLKALRKHVEAMSDDDPLFRLLTLEEDADDGFSFRLAEWLDDRLGHTGFDYDSTPGMFFEDLREFVTAKGE